MKHSEHRFTGSGGRSIYHQYWEPETAPRAVLLLVHGAGEHSARYQSFAQYFTGFGFAVAAMDLHGHGYSEGRPGYMDAFGDHTRDLAELHQRIAARFAGVPVFLVGHSMGGLIACHYLLRQPDGLSGAILSGPAIMTAPVPGKVQMLALRLLARIAPRLGVIQLDPAGVSRDADVVARYIADPLVYHGKLSARLLRELFAGMRDVQEGAARIALPILIMHGGDDVMTAPEGSRFLYERIGSTDRTLRIWPGLYHEIFNEPEREQVLALVLEWCESRLAGR